MPTEEHPGARNSDPSTSHVAAKRSRRSNHSDRVLALLRSSNQAMSTHMLVDMLGIPWSTVSPRLAPLFDKGLIEDSGIRVDGCIAYVAVSPERINQAKLRNLEIRAERNKRKQEGRRGSQLMFRSLLERSLSLLNKAGAWNTTDWAAHEILREEIKRELS